MEQIASVDLPVRPLGRVLLLQYLVTLFATP